MKRSRQQEYERESQPQYHKQKMQPECVNVISVNQAKPPVQQRAKATLWINQLPYTATKEDIAAHFAEAARMSAVALLPSVRMLFKEGSFRGTAFVDMNDWEAVDSGCSLNNSHIKCADRSTRKITVREAVPKTQLQKQAAAEEMERKA
eukprot:CAMPEP_0181240730 /NCGR_PEP_ID=MMETSP1096-20121128/40704_1 /TAXON_ID=156174 ORGANISM="Chrysochromulina ericina, Strain CCMP281" /NCGR_SAMPLE_ID=MMETSP1096 /ASSEMBLY_ACC=CAM_ASM_000453 /LENGTH=148 /DNA_ID=CAMNT_0023336675 /DNA_START=348 /DNA_END=790 /DNA_ORIENTATION=+